MLQNTPPNSWYTDANGIMARRLATRAFCEYLDDPLHATEREDCRCKPDVAKKLFARLGNFLLEGEPDIPEGCKPIPTKTTFLVYETDPPEARDELVTLVLPIPGTMGGPFEATEVYRCTYWPWSSKSSNDDTATD